MRGYCRGRNLGFDSPGGEPITSVYAPDFLTEGGVVELGGDIAELAVLALDRVLDERSEWRDLCSYAKADSRYLVFASIAALRKVLDSMDVPVDQPTLWSTASVRPNAGP